MKFSKSVSVRKIEFQDILQGLQAQSQCLIDQKQMNEIKQLQSKARQVTQGQNTVLVKFKLKQLLKGEEEARQFIEEIKSKQQKLENERLEKQFRTKTKIPEGKVPSIPVTLMNSTIKNKTIQIMMILKQQRLVLEQLEKQKSEITQPKKGKPDVVKSRSEQDKAIREILQKYGEQLNYRSVTQHKQKRQVDQIKERYTQDLFIKNKSMVSMMKPKFQKQITKAIINSQSPLPDGPLDQIGSHHQQTQYQGSQKELLTSDSQRRYNYTQHNQPYLGSEPAIQQKGLESFIPITKQKSTTSIERSKFLCNDECPRPNTYCNHIKKIKGRRYLTNFHKCSISEHMLGWDFTNEDAINK